MITLSKVGEKYNTPTHEYILKSTDTKPTELVPNGSVCFVFDKNELYVFDGEAKEWVKI